MPYEMQRCNTCNGTGRVRCSSCGGTGHGIAGQTYCFACGGNTTKSCSRCNGLGKQSVWVPEKPKAESSNTNTQQSSGANLGENQGCMIWFIAIGGLGIASLSGWFLA